MENDKKQAFYIEKERQYNEEENRTAVYENTRQKSQGKEQKAVKKIAGIVLLCMMGFTLAACGQSQECPASAGAESSSAAETFSRQETGTEAEETGNGTGNILIAYFSWSGNTEAVAGMIQEEMGGDLFEIAPAEPYTRPPSPTSP